MAAVKVVLCLCLLAFVVGCTSNGATPAAPVVEMQVSEGEVRVGEPAPDFTVGAVDGRVFTLSELKGQAVILNVWATWCAPCRIEMPELEAAYQQYQGDGLQIIAIEAEDSGSAEDSAAFLAEVGATFPNVRDDEGKFEDVYVRRPSYPLSIFIDREGIVQYVQFGPMTAEFISERLTELGF